MTDQTAIGLRDKEILDIFHAICDQTGIFLPTDEIVDETCKLAGYDEERFSAALKRRT